MTAPRKRRTGRGHPWAGWQYVGALVMLLTSIAMFLLMGVDQILFGKDVDFSIAAPSFLGISVYVLYGIRLQDFGGKDDDPDE